MHLDDLGCMTNGDSGPELIFLTTQLTPKKDFIADEDQVQIRILLGTIKRSRDYDHRPMVPAHGVQRNRKRSRHIRRMFTQTLKRSLS